MVCGHGSERIARLPLAAALNNPVASNSARNTRTLSDLGGLSTSTCSHETHRRAFPKLQPRHSHVRRPLVPNGGMTFALLAPCSLRPSGHLRCASSAPPCASVVSSQTSAAKRRLRVCRIMDSKIIYLGHAQRADRMVWVPVPSESDSAPPMVQKWDDTASGS